MLTVATPEPRAPAGAAPRTAVVAASGLTAADRAAWRELLAWRPDSAPFVDEAWTEAWSAAFRPPERLFLGSWEEGRLVGLGVFQTSREAWAGRRTAVLQSVTNVESPRFEFLAAGEQPAPILERMWQAVCVPERWDVIRVEQVPEDSPTVSAGLRVADALGWNHVVEPALESPWRPLPRAADAWDEGLKRKFKSNLRNRERRLHALGDVTFAVARAGAELRPSLDLFYALEASGWKGRLGTAIARHASVKAFYDGLAERGRDLWIPILSVGGRAVAAQLIRLHGRALFLLKTAYDPEFAPYAPGQLLTARVMRYGIDHGMEALDFLGHDMTWKRDWEPRLRRHVHLLLFAPSTTGRYAYWTRYGVREHAKRIPGATRLVRWLRARWRTHADA